MGAKLFLVHKSPSLQYQRLISTSNMMSGNKPSVDFLIDAILCNSSTMVKKYLNSGVDPNENLMSVIPGIDNVWGVLECKVPLALKNGQPPSSLHIAHCSN
jgi:hypothetical protein